MSHKKIILWVWPIILTFLPTSLLLSLEALSYRAPYRWGKLANAWNVEKIVFSGWPHVLMRYITESILLTSIIYLTLAAALYLWFKRQNWLTAIFLFFAFTFAGPMGPLGVLAIFSMLGLLS